MHGTALKSTICKNEINSYRGSVRVKRILKDLKKYFKFTLVSAQSQLKAEVANSYLNWVWWILEPVCFMLIYVLIFGVVFNAKEANFPVFIFVGITVWDFFNRMLNVSVKLVRNNKAIVSKVYLPKYVLLLTKVWVNGFKMLISFGIIAAMMIFYKVSVNWHIVMLVPILINLMLISFGIGTWLMHFGVFIDDLSNVVNIVLRVLFYLTGIFYNVEQRLPAPAGTIMLKANPMAFLLDGTRKVLLYGEMPSLEWLLFWFVLSALIAYGGIRMIYKNENSYVKVL